MLSTPNIHFLFKDYSHSDIKVDVMSSIFYHS